MARLDALNIFDKEENGFDSPSTGIVTLIATAEAIKKSLVNRLEQDFPIQNSMVLNIQYFKINI